MQVFVVAESVDPEQLFAVVPSVSRNEAEWPAGLAASSQVKSKPMFAPLGPDSEALAVSNANGRASKAIATPIERIVKRVRFLGEE